MIPAATFNTEQKLPTALDRVHPAVRWAGAMLGLASCLLAGAIMLGVLALALAWWLDRTGLGLRGQMAALRPWLWACVLVLLLHTFTATWAAPLWHPSWGGLFAGVKALARVACSIGWLGLYLRTSSLDDLVLGVRWWLRPLAGAGLPVENLGLVLAVALGTAPGVLSEGRRIETVVRLRRSGPRTGTAAPRRPGGLRRAFSSAVDRAHVVIPLLETMVRRAEALSLSLRTRRPAGSAGAGRLPALQMAVLVLWFLGLVWVGFGLPWMSAVWTKGEMG